MSINENISAQCFTKMFLKRVSFAIPPGAISSKMSLKRVSFVIPPDSISNKRSNASSMGSVIKQQF